MATITSVVHSGNMLYAVATVPETGELLTSGQDSRIAVHDPAMATRLRTVGRKTGYCTCVAPMPGGVRAVSSLGIGDDSRPGVLQLESLTTATAEPLATYDGHTAFVTAVVVTSVNAFASSSGDRTVRLWDAAREAPTATLAGYSGGPVKDLAPLSDQLLVSVSSDKTVAVWDPRAAARVASLPVGGDASRVTALRGSGNTVAVGLYSGAIELLDLRAGAGSSISSRKVGELRGHSDRIRGLAQLPDGRLASASWDKTVRIWDVAARSCVTTFEAPAPLHRCCATSDGQLAVGCGDGHAYLYGGWAWSRRCDAAAAWEAVWE